VRIVNHTCVVCLHPFRNSLLVGSPPVWSRLLCSPGPVVGNNYVGELHGELRDLAGSGGMVSALVALCNFPDKGLPLAGKLCGFMGIKGFSDVTSLSVTSSYNKKR
jgi:hypothetical protein